MGARLGRWSEEVDGGKGGAEMRGSRSTIPSWVSECDFFLMMRLGHEINARKKWLAVDEVRCMNPLQGFTRVSQAGATRTINQFEAHKKKTEEESETWDMIHRTMILHETMILEGRGCVAA